MIRRTHDTTDRADREYFAESEYAENESMRKHALREIRDGFGEAEQPRRNFNKSIARGHWAWVDSELLNDPHLRNTDKIAYLTLASFDGYAEVYPPIKLLCERSGLSPTTMRSSIRRLEELGFIAVRRGRGRSASRYRLLEVREDGCKKCRAWMKSSLDECRFAGDETARRGLEKGDFDEDSGI